MKPATVIVLCVACSFAATMGTHLLYYSQTQSPGPGRTSPAPTSDPQTDPTGADQQVEQRLQQLENELVRVQSQLDQQIQAASVGGEPARLRPEWEEADAEVAGREGGAGDGRAGELDGVDPAAMMVELDQRLAEIEQGEAAARALRKQAMLDLEAGSGRDRRDAAQLLGALARGGDREALQILRDSLAHESPEVREDALEGIGESGLPELIPDLEQAMDDEHPDVREEVAEALRQMPKEEAGPLLVRMLRDEHEGVLEEAIEGLSDLGYASMAMSELLPLANHRSERVAIRAAVALREAGDSTAAERWVHTLGERLASDDAEVRGDAVRTLGRMRLESARPYLEQAAQDLSEGVRRRAERALRELDE